MNAPSVVYDAVFVPGGAGAAMVAKLGLAVHFVTEACYHGKPIGAAGEGVEVLKKAHVDTAGDATKTGVVTGTAAFTKAMLKPRFPNRDKEPLPV